MNFVIIILLLTLSGCYGSDSPGAVETKDEITLDLWMDLPIKNGHYVFDYPTNKPSSYTRVYYQTIPMGRVFWTSPDSFTIVHLGIPITEPIINYSTYADGETGQGQQLIYIYPPHIGDTLNVIGCIGNVCKEIEFVVR